MLDDCFCNIKLTDNQIIQNLLVVFDGVIVIHGRLRRFLRSGNCIMLVEIFDQRRVDKLVCKDKHTVFRHFAKREVKIIVFLCKSVLVERFSRFLHAVDAVLQLADILGQNRLLSDQINCCRFDRHAVYRDITVRNVGKHHPGNALDQAEEIELGDICTSAAAGFHQTQRRKLLQNSTDGDTTDAVFFGEIILCRETVAGIPVVFFNFIQQCIVNSVSRGYFLHSL